jgi:hypothetical protein
MSASGRITHGRHCSCTACAREDWTRITGPCGMHGKDCPSVYAPICSGDDYTEAWNAALERISGAARVAGGETRP